MFARAPADERFRPLGARLGGSWSDGGDVNKGRSYGAGYLVTAVFLGPRWRWCRRQDFEPRDEMTEEGEPPKIENYKHFTTSIHVGLLSTAELQEEAQASDKMPLELVDDFFVA